MSEDPLVAVRTEINDVDSQILSLISQRAKLAQKLLT